MHHIRIAAAFFAGVAGCILGCGGQGDAAHGPLGPFDAADGEFTETDSGLKYRITREGTGKMPLSTDGVQVHYEGKLADGTLFDSSYKRKEPAEFPLNMVIAGWTEGMQLVAEGGMIDLIVPGDLAYGPNPDPRSGIPPNATLYFTVELLAIAGHPHPANDSPEEGAPMAESENPLGPFADTEGEFATTDSGLKYRITREGEGGKPKVSDTVQVHYVGKFADGREFDRSQDPAEFPLDGVIRGWTEGMQLVAEGGKIDLIVPGDLAYGPNPDPRSGLPPNATLYFSVELLKILP